MSLAQLMQKQDKLVIGLMSGTSADAVDAVLVQITGHGLDTVVRQRAYVTVPFDDAVREEILRVARGDYGGLAPPGARVSGHPAAAGAPQQ